MQDFSSMKLLHVFLLPPPGWVASLSQGYPLHPYVRQDALIHPGGERHYDISVSCPRTVTTQRLQPGLWTRNARSGVKPTKQPRFPRRTTTTDLFLQFGEAFWTESAFNHRPETRGLHVSNDILAKDFFIAPRVNTTYRLITAFISVFLITEQTNKQQLKCVQLLLIQSQFSKRKSSYWHIVLTWNSVTDQLNGDLS